MFGLEASEPAKKSLKIFQENNINTIIELGAGLGRDSIYFSINNLSVTSLVDNETVRTVYIVRPDKRIGLFLTYPMTTGRNFAEILRAIDSMQRTAKHKIATPADWKPGEDVIIVPKVTNEEAKKIYPDGWETIKPYLRKVPDPQK